MKKLLSYLLLLLGVLLFLAGAVFVIFYFRDAIILRIGEPDQSLIFWYLPLLFSGVIGIIAGIRLVIFGRDRLKQD